MATVHYTNQPATAFEAVISAWDEQVRCAMPTKQRARCQRPAYWRVDLHGCERVLVCGQHKQAWIRRALAQCRSRLPACVHCGRMFSSLDARVQGHTAMGAADRVEAARKVARRRGLRLVERGDVLQLRQGVDVTDSRSAPSQALLALCNEC
jgi:hypothetical protein